MHTNQASATQTLQQNLTCRSALGKGDPLSGVRAHSQHGMLQASSHAAYRSWFADLSFVHMGECSTMHTRTKPSGFADTLCRHRSFPDLDVVYAILTRSILSV